MTARTCIGEPQREQHKGSTSYTFASTAVPRQRGTPWRTRTDSGCRAGQGRGAQRRLRLVIPPPALGSQAGKVGLAGPRAARSRGIQTVATNQSCVGVGKVLQDFDQELCGGEQRGVCSEVGIIF